ncbi:DUF5693 family protein [Anaeromicrobium sediminis]|uniref:Beta-carotene 15,15'-monooxygenase n=1 Tax=Anaeromicrobium sediminis TaxID=1478221 RepID=A0A267MIK2_9FIRM|nr:DUF5693 family protein [Anaeromicrobium sediminis]PAB58758.1 hypothetical protein CCE28_13895 [Anaeromicrobium sediminis]
MRKNPFLICVLIVSILASMFVAVGRINTEKENKYVDVILDYDEMNKMAKQSEKDLKWWLEKFKEMNVYGVAINEESINSMIKEGKNIKAEMIGNIIEKENWEEKYPDSLLALIDKRDDIYDVLLHTDSEANYNFIKEGLTTRYGKEKFWTFKDDEKYYIYMDGRVDEALYTKDIELVDYEEKVFKQKGKLYSTKVLNMGLGLDKDKIDFIKSTGLKVIPRPMYYEIWGNGKTVHSILNQYEELDVVPKYMIFAGSEVLGYKEYMDETAKYMKENNILVGMIESGVQREHIKQKGLYELVEKMNYDVTRVFTVWPYIQERYKYYNYEGAEEIENTLNRAITERNIRLIYFKPFKYSASKYVTEYDAYEDMFKRFETRLSKSNLEIGRVVPMKERHVRVRHKLLIGLGIVSGTILLLNNLIETKKKYQYILFGLGSVCVFLLTRMSLGDKILAMMAAIVFPSLSVTYMMKKWKEYNEKKITDHKKIIVLGIKTLLVGSCISLIGAFMVGTILSDIRYMLEMDIYRGVKFSQLLPILVMSIAYLIYFGYKRGENEKSILPLRDIKRLFLEDIKVLYVFAGVVVLIAGYVYMARTGHESNIQPSTLEMIFRNILEEKLIARPRNKEFLVAFPAVIVCTYAACRRYNMLIFLSALAVIIGQTSIVNTFCHLRTPMLMSIIRTIYSLGFGIVLGIVYMIALEIIIQIGKKLRGLNV